MKYEQILAKSHCGTYHLIQDMDENLFDILRCVQGKCQPVRSRIPRTEAWSIWEQVAPESFDLGFPH